MNILPIALTVLLLLPALFLGHRIGAFERPLRSWLFAALVVAVVWSSFPAHGASLEQIKLLKGLLAVVAASLLWARARSWPFVRSRRDYLWALIALAALSSLSYANFGFFHGQRSFVHLHDLAHYYLGAKYYAELEQVDLYEAMLRAESEWTGDRFESLEARDLEADELVHIRTLLQQSAAVKAKFSAARWEAFQIDAAMLRDALGPQYSKVLRDHGFNATPVWALLGSPAANLVPAGNRSGLLFLSLLDPLLGLALFGAIVWAFGSEAALVALIYLCVVFGADFAWTGGSFLRMPWLATLVGFVCCLHRRRPFAAGGLLALSTGLRVFPAFFAVPLLARAISHYRAEGRLARSHALFFAGLTAAACMLFAASMSLPRGWQHWSELATRLSRQVEVLSPNLVGLTQLIAYRGDTDPVTRDELRAIRQRREDIHRVQLWLVALPVLLLVLRRSPRRNEEEALVLAVPLIFASLSLASYYSSLLVVIVLVYARRPQLLALLFALEALSQLPGLFSEREAAVYAIRSALLTLAFAALLFEWGPFAPAKSAGDLRRGET